ncbi:MAG TPA: GTPase ObgE, partial [Thermodesulfobacteriota bacterium]|nr:GTPase ObgE [Thermodesulfobacteriota bacterium]
MKFVDEVVITVRSGAGGPGAVSFRREARVPRGGPDGGDGGRGGDVVLEAVPDKTTLLDLQYQQLYRARDGERGGGGEMAGRSAPDLVVQVPVGTVVRDPESGAVLADLDRPGARWVAARGGRGGKGNAHFKSPTRRAPRFAQPGEPGEERRLKLELKLLADVGLIGLPNAGKSTLVAAVSAARPKIAPYPFTTLVPQLGVVRLAPDRSFVVADIPGLIEGAAQGAGLGLRFLKHVERCRLLLHLIDIAEPAASPEEAAAAALRKLDTVNRELAAFHPALAAKPQLVVPTKLDLPDAERALPAVRAALEARGLEVVPISAATHRGVRELVEAVARRLFAPTAVEPLAAAVAGPGAPGGG